MKKILFTFLFITTIFAQDVVSIVTSGDGSTKDQATTAALRNAIEQAYGAFISSNTKFLNDELIQDEIVSLSQGTITEYSIISFIETKNGYNVTTKSTVSLGKLTSFVQSKGGKTELAGALFARNIKILNFNEENQKKVLNNMYLTVKEMAKAGFYDFEIINIGEPKKLKKESEWNSMVGSAYRNIGSAWNNKYYVPFQIKISKNKNFENAMIYIGETLLSIGLSKEEQAKYLDVDKYVYDLRMLFDNMPRTITFDDTFLNRRQGLVGKTFTTTRDEYKYISLIGENPTDEIWRTLKIFDEELYRFKISNGASKDYFNLYPHSAIYSSRNFNTASYFQKNYSWIAHQKESVYRPALFSYTDKSGNVRDGLTNIKMGSRRRFDPPTPAEKVGNHPFMFSLDNKSGYIDVDNVKNWMSGNVNTMYADYWIWGKNYTTNWILINPEFSITINFLNFLTLDELSNIKSYNIEPTRKFNAIN